MNEQLKVIISAEVSKFKKNVDDAKSKIKNFVKEGTKDFGALNDEFQKYGDAAKKGLQVAAGAMVGAATALVGLTAATKDYRTNQAKLITAFETAGASANVAKDTYNDLYRVLGEDDTAVEAANHLAKLTTNQADLSQWTTICQGIYATFGSSLPIESLTEAANETAKVGTLTGGLADALNWAGVNEEKFQEQLDKCNTEAEREALIRSTLSGLYTDAAAKYEKNAEGVLKQNEAQIKLNENLAKIGETMEPINAALTTFISDVLEKIAPDIEKFINEHGPAIEETLTKVAQAIGDVLTWISDNWEFVSTLAIIIAGISAALAVFSTVMGIVNAVMLASPVTWIVLAIVAALAALVAIIVLCVKHWDEIKAATSKAIDAIKEKVKAGIDKVVEIFNKVINFVKENWQGLLLLIVNPFAGAFKLAYDNCEGFRKNVDNFVENIKSLIKKGFDKVKSSIIDPITDAKDKVKGVVDQIKSFFNFKVSLPSIKLPHFSIKPKGWEIGDLLKGSIPKLGIEWYAKGGVFERPTAFGMNGNNVMVGGEAGAEAIVPLENNTKWLDKIADKLAAKQAGYPVVMNVDGKVFAQTAIKTINDNTKQTGSLALKLYQEVE